jgi:hypothetical protein
MADARKLLIFFRFRDALTTHQLQICGSKNFIQFVTLSIMYTMLHFLWKLGKKIKTEHTSSYYVTIDIKVKFYNVRSRTAKSNMPRLLKLFSTEEEINDEMLFMRLDAASLSYKSELQTWGAY